MMNKELIDIIINSEIYKGMEADRDKFYKLYHDLHKEKRDLEIEWRKYNKRLQEENNFLMTISMEYKKNLDILRDRYE